jgi:ABC-type nickel/cobalt efflux system permease component RcnA
VTLVGIWLLWHALRHRHDANLEAEHRSGAFLAIAAGAIPCPLTTFIMTWAVLNGAIAAGLILSGAFAAGMITTVMFFPLVAVFSRGQLSRLSDDAQTLGSRIGHALGIVAALAVILVGAWPLLKH